MVVLDAVERLGVEPAVVAGHSVGEYAALVAAGVLSVEDAARIVDTRGEAMAIASAEQPGTMAAVLGADDDAVEKACARVADDVWVANYNAPGQVVIAGSTDAVAAAGDALRAAGAKRVMPLAVAGAFHTPFQQGARPLLRKVLADVVLRDPLVPVIANVDATSHPSGEAWRDLLVAHLCSPVQWRATLHHLEERGVTAVLELGGGTTLTGLAKRTIGGVQATSVGTPDQLDELLDVLAGVGPSAGSLQGEHLYDTTRLVVAPAAGVFRPTGSVEAGATVEVGALVGHVGEVEVRTPFAGEVMGCLALDGERLGSQQPVLWLRSA
jgi:[acyl-carrier-protein] S-malonyltransferase